MSKLYFRYSAMNAGKSTALLQVAHNYEERSGMVSMWTSALDTRYGTARIASRLGVSRAAEVFDGRTDFASAITGQPACVLIDEAQFLATAQVEDLHRLAHLRGIPVLCFGLRTDFRGQPFAGAIALLSLADDLEEIKTVCRCGKKATMTIRLGADGQRLIAGAQVEIGGNERYESVCARRFYANAC